MIGRSAGALLFGFVFVVLASLGTDQLFRSTGVYPSGVEPMEDWLFAMAAIYRAVYAVGGSYIAARMAPNRPMHHALTLGLAGLLISGAGAVTTWNAGAEFGPPWYAISLVVTALPSAWAGGLLYQMRGKQEAAA